MQFIVMHKVDAAMEAGVPPSTEIIRDMGALVQESLKNGVFLNGAGLHKSARRVRVNCEGGECTVTRGPYTGQNELVSSVTMLSTRSLDEAIGHARRLGTLLGGVEVEVGPVVEPWDLGMLAKPEGPVPERFLLLAKSTPGAEHDAGAGAQHQSTLERFAQSVGDHAAVVFAEVLAPSVKGARLASGAREKRHWVDGPFAESKELIAGFSLIGVPSLAAAITWANRYAAILGENEVDIREVNDHG